MKHLCAWCQKEMGNVHPEEFEEDGITHGICADCKNRVFAELNMERSLAFLDKLAEPVLVVDSEVVVLTANSKARQILGKSLLEITGFSGGKIIECIHAHEPGGCGKNIHCNGCAIRIAVADTHATGKSHVRVPAYADIPESGKTGKISFVISTEKAGEVVLLRIDRAGNHGEEQQLQL